MLSLIWGILSKFGVVALSVSLLCLAWVHLGPKKPEISNLRRQAIAAITPQVVEALRQGRGGMKTITFVHLADDPSDQVSLLLRRHIERSGVLHVHDSSPLEKLRGLMQLPLPAANETVQALALAGSQPGDAVLFGIVERFEETGDGVAVLDLYLVLASPESGRRLWSQRFNRRVTGGVFSSSTSSAEEGATHAFFQTFFSWVLLVLLLPIFTIRSICCFLCRESNRVNGTLLILYTIADTILAVLLIGLPESSLLAFLVLVMLVAMAFFYNVWIMTVALRMVRHA